MDFYELNNQGKLWIQRVNDINTIGHSATDGGRLVYSKSDKKVYIATSTQWIELATKYSVLKQGTKMLFGYYPLPIGWNITTEYNDVMVLLTNNSLYIGDIGGDWTITGLNEDGGHNHSGVTYGPNTSILIGKSEILDYAAGSTHTHTILADGLHSHTFDGNWRPEHINFCEAIFQ